MDIQRRRPEPELYQQRKTSFKDSSLNVSPVEKKYLSKKNFFQKRALANILSRFSYRLNYKKIGIALSGVILLIGGVFLFRFFTAPVTLSTITDDLSGAGQKVQEDLMSTANSSLTREEKGYLIQDDNQEAIKITYAGQSEEESNGLAIAFPDDISEPLEVRLDEKRMFKMIDQSGVDYNVKPITGFSPDGQSPGETPSLWKRFFGTQSIPEDMLSYQSRDGRKTLLYAYQKDSATGEKRLRQWTLYENGTGQEEEKYRFEGANLRIKESGEVEVRYQSEQDLKNQTAAKDVDPSLMERAQKVIQAEMGADMNAQTPADAVIPKPFYLDKDGKRSDLEWKIEGDTLKLAFSFDPNLYPIALDPTLQFTARSGNSGGTTITGEATSSYFGGRLTAGDMNSDGKADLIVGAPDAGSFGKVWIFYGKNSSVPVLANSADVTILGASIDNFGYAIATGDLNSDGRTDLAVSANISSGATYIFYNDGSISTTSAGADITITGEASSGFSGALATGDFNADGRTDLVGSSIFVSSDAGRAYIFYNDGSIPTTAASADVIISGQISSSFGGAITSGDFNADGKTDLAVGATGASSFDGRAYIFYNDGSIPISAATADVIITGESASEFGISLNSGDLNADGKVDLAVASQGYSSYTGRAYIFYNDGSIPTTAATADVTITGEASSNYFGTISAGDLNSDGRTDLIVGATGASSNGRAYIFYNDGSIPTTAATADVIITGETSGGGFGVSFAVGDFNTDGKIDFVSAAAAYSSGIGRAYIFYSQNGQVNTNFSITGENSSDFGIALTTGDLNADGKIDLVVGANGYSTNTGRAYIFYNDSSIPTSAATADVTLTGSGTNSYFGQTIATGDLNSDGKIDVAVGAPVSGPSNGNVYIFYNDGSYPSGASTADVTIAGTGSDGTFGKSLVTGDFNTNGRIDIGIGGNAGDAFIFYNDGSFPANAGVADESFSGSDNFGASITAGDLNADGRIDFVVAQDGYSSGIGQVYIFYNDGSYGSADVTITGSTSYGFGIRLATGDLNADGKTDLIVGGNVNGVWVFYNDGSYPGAATSADLIITGSSGFSAGLSTGDLNADGRIDLVVGNNGGNAYIFYNDGSIPTTSATADVTITESSSYFGATLAIGDITADKKADLIVGAYDAGSHSGRVYIYETRDNFSWQFTRLASSTQRVSIGTGQEMTIDGVDASAQLGYSMTSGDFNADGKIDLAIGAKGYSSTVGRVYIFYNGGNMPSSTAGMDSITGESGSSFGDTLAAGDFNADGKTDLVVGTTGYSSNTGRAYIFYNDASIPYLAASADVIITGQTTNNFFSNSITVGDFNSDGRVDLAMGANQHSGGVGRAYIFYNDGSIPTTAATADVIITNSGATTFGTALTAGDLNFDGKVDLIVSAPGGNGTVYVFYNDGSIPTTSATADVTITGETTSFFGGSLDMGDLNANGRVDLIVGARNYSGGGRAYIFYNDGSIPTTAATADVIITGETSSGFGSSLVTGDLNSDGKVDLIVSTYLYSSNTGRAYIFYNDGSIPTTAITADNIITGEATSDSYAFSLLVADINRDGKSDLLVGATGYSTSKGRVYIYTFNDISLSGGSGNFGYSLATGDLNFDGKIDLVVGARTYSSSIGAAFIFYSSNAVSPNAATADVTITGEASSLLGASMITGDFNSDGRTDLAVGAYGYSTNTGRAYIFYNDGSIPTTAATADVIITGEATNHFFSTALTAGDFNADGKVDLATGAHAYSSSSGRTYIFYNDGSIPTTAATADVIINGEAVSTFGVTMSSGDFNADGRTDLVVGGYTYSSGAGRVYILYNDGSIPTTAATADVIITGEPTSVFGTSMIAGDLNADGRADLAVGAQGYSTNTGQAYIFYSDGSIPTTAATADVTITGETTNNYFGVSVAVDDLNADGRADLAVGANGYSSNTGRAYIFYNDGSIPTTAATADNIMTGITTSNHFGYSLATGDFNFDGKKDLSVGAYQVSATYTFISETNNGGAGATTNSVTPERALEVRGSTQWRGSGNVR